MAIANHTSTPKSTAHSATSPHTEPTRMYSLIQKFLASMGSKLARYTQTVAVSLLICLSVFMFSSPVWASVQIKLTNLTYERCTGDLGKNMVMGGGIMSANCYVVKGEANNPSGKVVYNADIFGRIYDANGNDAMPERTRLGAVDEIPAGKSKFEIVVGVPAEQPEPLELKQFKASGFAGKVRR